MMLHLLIFVIGCVLAGNSQDLLWGPYNPGVFSGFRSRDPELPTLSFLWHSFELNTSVPIRYTCDNEVALNGYGWTDFDPRLGGRHVVDDAGHKVIVETRFVKSPHGYVVRVQVDPKTPVSFLTYLHVDGATDSFDIHQGPDTLTVASVRKDYKFEVPSLHSFASFPVIEEHRYRATDVLAELIQLRLKKLQETYSDEEIKALSNAEYMLVPQILSPSANALFVQAIADKPFTFDISFVASKSAPQPVYVQKKYNDTLERIDQHFTDTYSFQAPFDTPEHRTFGKQVLSDLLGGIGAFHGKMLVDRTNRHVEVFDESALEDRVRPEDADEEGPYDLFTCTPSRSKFPRGFYWDEGFHLLPIIPYDIDLAAEILESWFSLVDEDGWIAREQILGSEARSRVPPDFQVQYPYTANPPTLVMALSSIIDQLHGFGARAEQSEFDEIDVYGEANTEMTTALKKVYPLVKMHYEWFRRTQRGEIRQYDRRSFSSVEGYRWRDRTATHCFASGLDDYPRAGVLNSGELNVDLLSWVGAFSRAMLKFAVYVGETEDAEDFEEDYNAVVRNIEDLHWIENENSYCDIAVVDGESVPACRKGYLSLFPFMLQLLDAQNPHIEAIVDFMRDPETIWSPYGLRSLSKQDPDYGTGENYWRSPIWININYLVLEALQKYGQEIKGPLHDKIMNVYRELRQNVVNTVYNEHKRTGYVWEQYDPDTGYGKGGKPFTGWTSLVVLIMNMPESL
ncbi:glycoside hydrolase family 63 protein [Tortispora caseinolytica NRRL Y-17796]|uniref:Mannosyl-oligosaccharide glucosidase n=1 Tax=Tortispora caseinolytica NRRL Y-17796 TaxID=767744 RepID=A0A1E4TD27_9ASCO|nr:glycoside hydrolase family 63 protein [Tortispora caseinolytica NRRL Y-17796]